MAESDALHEALIDNFCTVTGVSRERAQFYLQAAGWDFPVATSTFFDEGGEGEAEGGESVPLQETGSPGEPPGEPEDEEPVRRKPPSSGQRTGFASMAEYQRQKREDEEGRGRGEESQKFFAGGSEHSGQLISGPPRKKVDAKELASDVFAAAKTHGAKSVEEEEEERVREKSKAFRGTGFRLGDTEETSEQVQGGPAYTEPKKVTHTLTFWANGFCVDNGPLRTGESEEDRRFIKSVSKGEIPQELVHAARGSEVDVNIEDKRNEPYQKRAPKLVAFSGEGHKLGSMTPEIVSHGSQAVPEATPTAGTSASPPTVPLDPSQPTTSVQIRLADGTRLVAKFNPTHTVNDIRQYINLSRPAMSSAHYVLMTTFPNRELTDLGQTLAEAKLLNAVVVQRMK